MAVQESLQICLGNDISDFVGTLKYCIALRRKKNQQRYVVAAEVIGSYYYCHLSGKRGSPCHYWKKGIHDPFSASKGSMCASPTLSLERSQTVMWDSVLF